MWPWYDPPVQLQIEGIGGVCSATCNFCPLVDRDFYKNDRPSGVMSMDLFRKIIDEASTIKHINSVCITGLSETLLDRHLMERIIYTRARMPSNVNIDFFTNGVALTPSKFNQAKCAGISRITVSLNAVSSEQHDAIMHMGRSAYDRVVSNIRYAIMDGGVEIEVKAVVDGEAFTPRDGYDFYEQWGQSGFEDGIGQLVYEGNWAGELKNERIFDPKRACGRALGQIYVLYDGIVTACCFDPLGKKARSVTGHPDGFGNLSRQGIREVYNSAKYVEFREAHSRNNADKYQFCAVCSRI